MYFSFGEVLVVEVGIKLLLVFFFFFFGLRYVVPEKRMLLLGTVFCRRLVLFGF